MHFLHKITHRTDVNASLLLDVINMTPLSLDMYNSFTNLANEISPSILYWIIDQTFSITKTETYPQD